MGQNTNPQKIMVSHCTEMVWCVQDTATSEKSNSYLVVGSERALLFDAGTGLVDMLSVVRQITHLPTTVVLSHWHHDHVGGAHSFDDIYAWDTPRTRQLKTSGISSEAIVGLSGQEYADECGPVPPLPKLKLLTKVMSFDLGECNLELVHTPGHTQDSICLYEQSKGWLFTGDTVYPGPLYLSLPDSDRNQYKESLKKLQALKPRWVFPGHNTTIESSQVIDDCLGVAIMENE